MSKLGSLGPLALAIACAAVFTPGVAAARSPAEIDDADTKAKPACEDHCYILESLVLRADVKRKNVRFALTGQVLAPGPQIIPLFPTTLALSDARINGAARATVGFEDDAWYLRTGERRFTLTGTLALGEETSVLVKGPVNTVDASAIGGYVVDGNHYTAATELTVTFEEGTKPKDDDELPVKDVVVPTSFTIARFIDAGKTTAFEYRVKVTGPGDVRIPLSNDEKVADVTGARHSEGPRAITLTGPVTDAVVIRGTIADRSRFVPIGGEESVVVHTDADHEIAAEGNAPQIPIQATPFLDRAQLRATRAYRLIPGQKLDVTAKRRTSGDVLAAVVDRHERFAIWSASGDLVTLDNFSYDNSALDVFRVHTNARPIYLSHDWTAERILHDEGEPADTVSLSARNGKHDVRVQSLDHQDVRWLGGRFAMRMPDHGLTESTATISLGLPANVHPVYVAGGDETQRFYGSARQLLGFVLSLLVSLLVFTRPRSRVLATVGGFGAFCLAPSFFAGAAFVSVGLMLVRANAVRIPTKRARLVATGGGVALSLLVAGIAARVAKEEPKLEAASNATTTATGATDIGIAPLATTRTMSAGTSTVPQLGGEVPVVRQAPVYPSYNSNVLAAGGVVTSSTLPGGVTPVELPMPEATRAIAIRRTLVTRDRPFLPTIYYVTDAFFALAGILWLGSLLGLAWLHRVSLLAMRTKIRELLTPTVTAAPTPLSTPYRTYHEPTDLG